MTSPRATVRTELVRFVALAAGSAVAVIGIAVYEAWWTAAFALGGAAVAVLAPRVLTRARSIAVGTVVSGAILLAGMSVFFLYGSMRAPARPCEDCADAGAMWLAAAFGSIVIAVLLVLLVRRLLAAPAEPHDTLQR
jgi:hypothetical protein